MKIAILGYAQEGESSLKYWQQAGNELTICDQNADLQVPEGINTQLGPDYLKNLDQYDVLVRTASLHPRLITAANPDAPGILDRVTTNVDEFMRVCPTKNLIGVTGTKGKGTTSTLITKMLEASGKTVYLAGNIGLPALDLLQNNLQADDWVVLELSSFQLISQQRSPHIAVCLMVVPEHLDWHEDLEEYLAAKQQLFMHQTPDDIAIYNAQNDNSLSIADASEGQLIPYLEKPGAYVADGAICIADQEICQTGELKLLGKHNWENVCAALTAVWQVAPNAEAMRSVLTTFAGLPFRLEFRVEKNGIRYYNDSFASAPPTPAAAAESIPGKKVLIIGGYDRMLPLEDLAKGLKKYSEEIRHIVLIGKSADRVAAVLKTVGLTAYSVSQATTMTDIVTEATGYAQEGDAVVLSPGFPSFDMFKNFEDRGTQFNQAVEAL